MYRVYVYLSATGASPIEEFLEEMPKKHRAKVLASVDYLSEEGPALKRPHAAHVRGRLRELRVSRGRNEYRVIYFFMPGKRIVLTHAFQKKTRAIPRREIEVAETRRRDYVGRVRRGEVKL